MLAFGFLVLPAAVYYVPPLFDLPPIILQPTEKEIQRADESWVLAWNGTYVDPLGREGDVVSFQKSRGLRWDFWRPDLISLSADMNRPWDIVVAFKRIWTGWPKGRKAVFLLTLFERGT